MPTPLVFDLPDYQANETLKSFDSTDSLAKSYLELNARATSGDISLVPEELRKDPTIAKFKTITDLSKSYIEANKLIGGIKHAPKDAASYQFTALKDLHPGVMAGVANTQKYLAGLFHANDIDNDRGDKIQQAIIMGLHQSMVKQDEARTAKNKEVETALRSDWGADYDKNVLNIENVFKRLGVEDLGTSIKSNPSHLKAAAKIVAMLSEDSIGKLGDGTGSATDLKTKEGAQKALEDFNKEVLKQGKDHPFYKGDEATIKKYNEILAAAYS